MYYFDYIWWSFIFYYTTNSLQNLNNSVKLLDELILANLMILKYFFSIR